MSKNNSGQKKFCEESEVEGRGRSALFSLRSLCSVGLAIGRTISDGLDSGSGSGSGLGKSCPNA